MQDLIERPEEEGCYIIDRRMQSVEDSVSQLSDFMFQFTQKTRRQRINQRNRVERLSPLLDWKNLGIEYSKARQLALRRAYPDAFSGHEGDELYEFGEADYFGGIERTKLGSMPASPRLKGIATPGDLGTLTEDVRNSSCCTLFTFINPSNRCKVSTLVTIVAKAGLSTMRRILIPCKQKKSPSFPPIIEAISFY